MVVKMGQLFRGVETGQGDFLPCRIEVVEELPEFDPEVRVVGKEMEVVNEKHRRVPEMFGQLRGCFGAVITSVQGFNLPARNIGGNRRCTCQTIANGGQEVCFAGTGWTVDVEEVFRPRRVCQPPGELVTREAIQARLWPRDDEERKKALDYGFDLKRVFGTTDLVRGEDVVAITSF